jgi:uncharacterized membrane protein YciS (DUF1049 family)
MRFLCFLFLLVFVGAVAAFAYENMHTEVPLRFLEWSGTYTLPLVIAAAYVLGMFSGWTIVGMLRRSIYRVTESRDYAGAR